MKGTQAAASPRTWRLEPWLQIVLILLVAAAFRFWAIDRYPPGLFGDEANDGLDALDVLAGRGQVFFSSNYGREGLYIWLVAGSIKLLGVTPFSTRLPAVLLGVATCGLAWWAARELIEAELRTEKALWAVFLRTWGPLLAGLFLATAYWHVHFSRFSQRTILTPFVIGLAVATLWRAINTGRLRWWAMAGLGIGLTLHSYSVGRFFPVFIALFLALDWVVRPRAARGASVLRRHTRGILIMIAVATLVFAPLAYYFVTHPGSFFERASAVATYSGKGLGGALATIVRSALANVEQYVLPYRGDMEQFHNLPGRPVFEPLTAILAVVGFLICLRLWRRPGSLFLILWTAVMTLPAALATDRFPTLPRVLGVLPGLYLVPVIGLAALLALLRQIRLPPRAGRLVAPGLVALAFVVPAAWTWRDYFVRWAPSPATFASFEGDMVSAWHWMQVHEPKEHVYISADIYRHPTFMYLYEHATVTRYFELQDPGLSWFDGSRALPLPPLGGAIYLIGTSAPLAPEAKDRTSAAEVVDVVRGPDGAAALTVLRWREAAPPSEGDRRPFGDYLDLLSARWLTENSKPVLELGWQTRGPVSGDWGGYRLEVESDGQVASVPFDAYRPPEWVAGRSFLTWHTLDLPSQASKVRLRLLRLSDGVPLGHGDGWQTVSGP